MALTRTKTWIAGAQLPASELNALEANIVDNQQDIGNPRTEAYDMDGNELILDSDGDTSITADSDDIIHFRLAGADLFILDGDAGTAVDGLTFTAAATANPSTVSIDAQGSSTNININLVPKGSGSVQIAGTEIGASLAASDDILLAAQVFGR